MFKIGEVAKRSGVGVETVRYYEREGLITQPMRSPSGYRQYSDTAVKQIQFVQHAKTLGFSLKEIKELISLKTKPGMRCESVKEKARKKIDEIQDKINALERMKESLNPLLVRCRASDPIEECPILNSIEDLSFPES